MGKTLFDSVMGMMGKFLNFDELMRRLEEREMRRKELLEWYKRRVELLSKRAK